MEKMKYEEFFELFGSYWAPLFKPFIESREFYNIYQRLKADSKKDKIFPASENTFRAFKTSFPQSVKVVFYLMDPYPRAYKNGQPQATGIAMDCSNSPDGTLQPSLVKFYEAMERELGITVTKTGDLRYLQEQGIMFLNTDLTCKKDKTGSHSGLWEPFQKFFLEEIMGSKKILYVLCGKESEKMEKFISPFGNNIIKLEHPAYAERQKTDWNSKGVFKTIDEWYKDSEQGHKKVFWDKTEFDNDLPF